MAPVKLTLPTIVLGITVLGGLGVIFGSATELVRHHLHPVAILWMVIFSAATLFGCTALMIRFFTKLLTMQRETSVAPAPPQSIGDRRVNHHLPPQRMEPVPSVTENTTRTFTPIYSEPADRGTR